MAGFKSAVTNSVNAYIDRLDKIPPTELQLAENRLKFNRNNRFFQPNYHDHIIRNRESYLKIKNYIIHNPSNWKE